MRAHSERSQMIKRCITEVSDIVNTLRKQRESGVDDPAITMKLRSERNKVQWYFSNGNVYEHGNNWPSFTKIENGGDW